MTSSNARVRVVIDRDLCVGSRLCVATDSRSFAIGVDGKYSSETVDVDLAEEAAELCPQAAISLVSEGGT